ncbi:hypothetical protein BH23ACT9_BH23ACT9_22550 [soil metagenome]
MTSVTFDLANTSLTTDISRVTVVDAGGAEVQLPHNIVEVPRLGGTTVTAHVGSRNGGVHQITVEVTSELTGDTEVVTIPVIVGDGSASVPALLALLPLAVPGVWLTRRRLLAA